ncbi:CotH kinase family protein [Luteolibacter pohnpeiensis]|uniref:CotH kinase family protein n=1 Tax=Luteolibacter pohnpeiensis TaxID=454153 RepID=A0A934S8Q7_9BACT|nr:CotH kinase family protein [Luteolibacter pohnpeiensis]MBK1883410.1 CotH kinase family protein [Luteolibacter pohnpeiensis]
MSSIGLANAQPVITEFMASNDNSITDEDGDHSDWIEIHNPTTETINLNGWHLTDKADNLTKWTFPGTTLAPDGYLVVFASNKDRAVAGSELHTNFALSAGGEYLALVAPDGVSIATEFSPEYPSQSTDLSYGVTNPSEWVQLFGLGSSVKYQVPTSSTLGDTWIAKDFSDTSWTTGSLGLGYDLSTSPVDLTPYITTNVQSQLYQQRTSIYFRVPFTVDDPSQILALEMRTRYDDGYAAFLNGGTTRVDAVNAPTTLAWNSSASGKVDDVDGLVRQITNLNDHISELTAGSNVMAFQGFNLNTSSTDFLVSPELWAQVPKPDEEPQVGFFAVPTPGAPNSGSDGLLLDDTVTFSSPSGTFTGSKSVTISGAVASSKEIRYTTDGSVPTATSTLYTGALTLNATTLLRARIFDSSGAGGATSTVHYLRLSSSLANRESNLPMIVMDAQGQTLNDTTRLGAYFQLFDRDENGVSSLANQPDVSTREGIRYRGSSSQNFPKKPYSVEFWDETDNGKDLEILDMPAESDWVFYAPYYFDRTYTRNPFIYEVSRRLGRYAPRTRFVEVFYNSDGGDLVDSDYAGVYVFMEQIKLNSTRIGYGTVDSSDVPPDGTIDPLAEGDWTGGYLLKIDRADSDEYDWRTNHGIPTQISGTTNSIILSRPKMEDLDGGPYTSDSAATSGSRQVAYIRSYVQSFEDALYADQADGFSTHNYLNYIDRDAWIDHLLMVSFSKNVDGLRLSAFFYKPQNAKLSAGPVWDFDRSMDSYDGRDDSATTWYGSSDATQYFDYDWWGMLSSDPDFAQKFYDRWAELRKTVFSDESLTELVLSMRDEIDSTANGLTSAAARDAARWSSNEPRSGSFTAETQAMLTWILNRASWIDNRTVTGGTLPSAPTITVSGNLVTISGSGTLYYTLDGSDPRASGGTSQGLVYTGTFDIGSASTLIVRAWNGTSWSTASTETFAVPDGDPEFIPTITADWNNNSNWSTSPADYPNGVGASPIIGPPSAGDRDVNLQASVTVGKITFPQDGSVDRNRIEGEDEGNSLTFDNGDDPAELDISGTGEGYVEIEVAGGTQLNSDLQLNVTNLVGDGDYGALRLRESWTGTGGITKLGAGVASFTGDDKLYSGATRIEEGVLQVTGPSAMPNTPSVTVLDGGQLRLTSGGSAEEPRLYTFGGDLFLNGSGRGEEIDDSSGLGKLGALRYDPGSNDNNLAILSNNLEFQSDTDLHVDGGTNELQVTGALRGTGSMRKTGGGILALSGDDSSYTQDVQIENGQLMLRGSIGSAINLADSGVLNVGGSTAALSGTGSLVLPGTSLTTPAITGLNRSMIFTTSAPDLSDSSDSGNALIITNSPGVPTSQDFYLDLSSVTSATIVQGGYLLPASASVADVLDASTTRVFIADSAGSYSFNGQTWRLSTGATLTSVPTTLSTSSGSTSGRILEIRFDGKALTYEAFRSAFFSAADAANAAISDPEATPFGDGVPNLLRYALGVGAGDNVQDFLPKLTFSGTTASFSFPYDPSLRGLRWIVESSSDLDVWNEADVLFDSSTDLNLPDSNGMLTISDEPTGSKQFYRLRVVEDATR